MGLGQSREGGIIFVEWYDLEIQDPGRKAFWEIDAERRPESTILCLELFYCSRI